MTRRQLAEMMGVSTKTIDRLVKRGMPSETWGLQARRFRPSVAMAWARAQTASPDDHVPPAGRPTIERGGVMDDPTQPLIDALCDELGVTDVELVDSVRNAIELAFRQGQTGHDRNLILAGLAYAVTEMVARHDSRAEPLTDAETQAVHDGVAAAFDLGVEAGRPSTGDPLIDAEIQMVDHQVDLFRQLMERAMKRIPATEELDEDAMREAVADLVMEDDEARDLLGRLGVLERFSRPQAEGGS